jgi:cytochrome c-type biogenesis protein
MSLFVLGSAIWLGILTSISPCPLASNIAAISFVSRKVHRTRDVFLSGALYTLGRALAYVALGLLLMAGLAAMDEVSRFLQKYMNQILGPVLILVGMILLELINLKLPGSGISGRMEERVDRWGVWGAGLLGSLFALSFCPISAALFFGSLIPLALQNESGIILPAVYGFGTGLPVFLFAILIALGARSVGKAYGRIASFEKWARRITGSIFIGVGIYYCLVHIFRILG